MLFSYCFLLNCLFKFFMECSFIQIFIQSIISYFAIISILSIFFQIEISNPNDVMTLYTPKTNNSHIITVASINPDTEITSLIKKIKEKTFIHPNYEKLKKVLKYKYGIWYWSYSENFNIDNHIEIMKENISNDELYEFMSLHASEIPFEKNHPQWKIYIAPKMKTNKTNLIFKVHHCITDGVALISYFINIGENNDVKYVNLPKIKSYQWFFIYFIGLLKIGYFNYIISKKKVDNNEFRNKKLTGIKNGYCSQPLCLSKVKDYSKSIGVGINDTILALIIECLMKEHKIRHGKQLKEFGITIAASLRSLPKSNQIYPLNNFVHIILHSLLLDEENQNFNEYVKKLSANLKVLKDSYDMYAQQLLGKMLYTMIPTKILSKTQKKIFSKYSATYSSVPGPLNKIKLYDCEIESLFCLVNPISENPILIDCISYNEKFVVGLIVDKCTGINVKEFIEDFTDRYLKLGTN